MPLSVAAWRIIWPAWASICCPSTVIVGIRPHRSGGGGPFHFSGIVAARYRPRRRMFDRRANWMLSVMENLPIQTPTARRFDPRRRGVALVMAVVVMGVLILISGLCIEAGNVMHQRTVMQDAADAAARAGAGTVGKGRDEALKTAYRVISENAYVHKIGGEGATVRLEYGSWSLENRAFTPTYSDQSNADAVRVTVNIPTKAMFVGNDTMPKTVTVSKAIARRPTLVLVVGDANNLGQNDTEMLRRMKLHGVPTQCLSDEKVQASLFTTEDVVMISSSTESGVDRRQARRGQVRRHLLRNLQLEGTGPGQRPTARRSRSTRPPTSAGPTTTTWTSGTCPRRPPSPADARCTPATAASPGPSPATTWTKVATWASDSSRVVAFYYEKGATLDNDEIAPGFRAGLFMRTEETYAEKWTYSADTWNTFDAMFVKCLPYVNKKVYLVQ